MMNRLGEFKVRQRPPASARAFPAPASEFLLRYRDNGEALLTQPFKGITTDGMVAPGLFKVEKTGVSTRPLKDAADAFLASLGRDVRAPRSPSTPTCGAAGATSIPTSCGTAPASTR